MRSCLHLNDDTEELSKKKIIWYEYCVLKIFFSSPFYPISLNYFRSSSLRVMSEEARVEISEIAVKDRGNFSQSSDVLNRTYNYSFGGYGPLAVHSPRAGDRPSLQDVKQFPPQALERLAIRLGGIR